MSIIVVLIISKYTLKAPRYVIAQPSVMNRKETFREGRGKLIGNNDIDILVHVPDIIADTKRLNLPVDFVSTHSCETTPSRTASDWSQLHIICVTAMV